MDLVLPNPGESLSAAVARVKKSFESAPCNFALSVRSLFCANFALQVVINSFSDSVKKEMEKVVSDGVNSFVIDVDNDDKLYQVHFTVLILITRSDTGGVPFTRCSC